MDVEELLTILSSGDFARLEGVSESGVIDFKREPYPLETEAGKFELAKDIAAFANAFDDAVIVLGVETETPADAAYEQAKRARPMPRELVVEKHYRDVIRQRCYPTVRGFTVEKYADGGDATRCLVAIRIPEQRDDDRPFLVLAPLSPDGDRVQGWLLGLPRVRSTRPSRCARVSSTG